MVKIDSPKASTTFSGASKSYCLRNVSLVVQWMCIAAVVVWVTVLATTSTSPARTASSTTMARTSSDGGHRNRRSPSKTTTTTTTTIPSLRGGGGDSTATRRVDIVRGDNDPSIASQCRFYLAESAIPYGGLGLFTAIDLAKGDEAQSMPDICIYVADTPDGTAFETHSWAKDVFYGQFEGKHPRAACEGFGTLFNSMPDGKLNVRTSSLVGIKQHTNAGLSRYTEPGAGAISHYYGISSKAERDVAAGSELTINYGDWDYDKHVKYTAPTRSVDWIRDHGMCIDNIEIHRATDPSMGRGAFAKRFLPMGSVVAPAPIQAYPSRKAFTQLAPEALFVNYCFEIKKQDDSILFFPYGPGVNLINHGNASSSVANVKVEWSNHYMSHTNWLSLPEEQFWQMNYPGAIIMDVIALRDIEAGEELFLDYGPEWESAWTEHVRNWRKPGPKHQYVYEEDMNLTQPFRTIDEQQSDPYPSNLHTVCFTNNWDRDDYSTKKYSPPKVNDSTYFVEGLVYCNILSREYSNKLGQYVYTVSLNFEYLDPDAKDKKKYVDTDVPHSAIQFVDKPYASDLHIPNAFRHPIGLPPSLIPFQWQQQQQQ